MSPGRSPKEAKLPAFASSRAVRGLQLSAVHVRKSLPHVGLILLAILLKWIEGVAGEPRVGFGFAVPIVLAHVLWGIIGAGVLTVVLAIVEFLSWQGTGYVAFVPLFLIGVWGVSMAVWRAHQWDLVRLRLAQEEEDVRAATLREALETERMRISSSRQRIEKVLMLTKVANDLTSTLDLREVIIHTLRRTKELSGEQGISRLVLFDESDTRVYRHTESGLVVAREDPDLMSEWVRKRSLPLHVTDFARDPRFAGSVLPGELRSGIASPMHRGRNVLGVLQVQSPVAGSFSQEDWRLLSLLTDLASVAIQNALLYQRTQEEAITDGLTGVFVHRYFRERLSQEVRRARETGIPLVLGMADIDDFKALNDTYGHLAGDAVLRRIAGVLRDGIRVTDLIARYGGEEFAILLVETPFEKGMQVAERLRSAVASLRFKELDELRAVSISIGLAGFPGNAADERELIERADSNLYSAKRSGKNKVIAAE